MMQTHTPHPRWNLYYLFAEDQQLHQLPPEKAEHMRHAVLELFNERNHTSTDPP